MSSLALTGERTLPGIAHENYWFRRHEAAYLWCAPRCAGAVVVDAGCGEGYGAALLRDTATRVVAIDSAPDVARHAARSYPGLDVVRADLPRLPVADAAAGVLVTLQTVEHLADQAGFVRECARALRPGGLLLLTTPNRLTFSPGRDVPLNPFHTRELSAAELREMLAPRFDVAELAGLRHGPRLRAWEAAHGRLADHLLAGPPDTWPEHLAGVVRSVRADDFAVSAADVDSALDLVAVAVRR